MKFDQLYDKLILELNQSTMHSALQKHEIMRDKNPVASLRAKQFASRVDRRTRDNGLQIQLTSNPSSNNLLSQFYVSLEDAHAKNPPTQISIRGLALSDPDGTGKSQEIEMIYDLTDGTLTKWNGDYEVGKLWLRTRSSAENLAKFIRNRTKVSVSWKNMDFLRGSDHLSQHADTRYSYDKIKSHTNYGSTKV